MAYGVPQGGVSMGTPMGMLNNMMGNAMGPLWQHAMRLPEVGNAYNIAAQMINPGFQGMGQGPTPWGNMMTNMLKPMMSQQHPGMSDASWAQGMQGIGAASEAEKAKTMGILGATGGGTVDPRAAAAAMSRIGAGVPQAVSNLAARRSQLDTQAVMGIGQLQGPLARQELVGNQQMGQQYGQELRGMASNILGSGVYGATQQGQGGMNFGGFRMAGG